MGIIRIDFDNFSERIEKLRECLNDIPKPLEVRISSGGAGLHIRSFHEDDKGYREKYDDPNRLELDRIREKLNLVNNMLSDKKNGKAAGEWFIIKNDAGTEYFIKRILKL